MRKKTCLEKKKYNCFAEFPDDGLEDCVGKGTFLWTVTENKGNT